MLLSKEVSEMLSLKDEDFNSRFLIDVMQHSNYCLIECEDFPCTHVIPNYWDNRSLVLTTVRIEPIDENDPVPLAQTFVSLNTPLDKGWLLDDKNDDEDDIEQRTKTNSSANNRGVPNKNYQLCAILKPGVSTKACNGMLSNNNTLKKSDTILLYRLMNLLDIPF